MSRTHAQCTGYRQDTQRHTGVGMAKLVWTDKGDAMNIQLEDAAYKDLGSLADIDVGFDLRTQDMPVLLPLSEDMGGLFRVKCSDLGSPSRIIDVRGDAKYVWNTLIDLGYKVRSTT